jgi:hypothetical protein
VALASTPVSDKSGILGVVVVASTLTDSELRTLKHLKGTELALFQAGSLVATSASSPHLVQVLREHRVGASTETVSSSKRSCRGRQVKSPDHVFRTLQPPEVSSMRPRMNAPNASFPRSCDRFRPRSQIDLSARSQPCG